MSYWHVYYRTTGDQESGHKGWRRADVTADSHQEALDKLLAERRNVFYARVYPAADALAVSIEWLLPTVKVMHAPHEEPDER